MHRRRLRRLPAHAPKQQAFVAGATGSRPSTRRPTTGAQRASLLHPANCGYKLQPLKKKTVATAEERANQRARAAAQTLSGPPGALRGPFLARLLLARLPRARLASLRCGGPLQPLGERPEGGKKTKREGGRDEGEPSCLPGCRERGG